MQSILARVPCNPQTKKEEHISSDLIEMGLDSACILPQN